MSYRYVKGYFMSEVSRKDLNTSGKAIYDIEYAIATAREQVPLVKLLNDLNISYCDATHDGLGLQTPQCQAVRDIVKNRSK